MKPKVYRASAVIVLLVVAASSSAQPAAGVAQVRFVGPSGLQVWVQRPGAAGFAAKADVTAPGRLNMRQGQTYRLKLADIPGRAGLTLYPTLQIAGPDARTAAFLQGSAIQLEVTPEDFDQAARGELVTRIIYLPGPGGGDGPFLAILRMGNIDLEGPVRR